MTHQITILEPKQTPTYKNVLEWNPPDPNEQVVTIEQEKVPYFIWFAEQQGYIRKGWNLQQYMMAAIKGDPNDKTKRAGFNNIHIWGDMGSGKSNLELQYGKLIFGSWEGALSHFILNLTDIVTIYDELKALEAKQREKDPGFMAKIPLVIADDLNTIFSKELWFEDRELYIQTRKVFNLIRPKCSNWMSSTPTMEDLSSIFSEKLNFEVLVFPNQTYMAERYCRFVDKFSPTSSYFKKVMIEFSKYELADVPSWVYEEYGKRRHAQIDIEFDKFRDIVQKRIDGGEEVSTTKKSANQSTFNREAMSKIIDEVKKNPSKFQDEKSNWSKGPIMFEFEISNNHASAILGLLKRKS